MIHTLSRITRGAAIVTGSLSLLSGLSPLTSLHAVKPELGAGGTVITGLFMSAIIVYKAGLLLLRPPASPPLQAAVAFGLCIAGLEAVFWPALSRFGRDDPARP